MKPSWVTLVLLALALAQAQAQAHGEDHELEDQLVKDGEKLVVGKFTASQPGPLVVVPYVESVPECAGAPSAGVTLPLAQDASITFFVGPDGLHGLFDLPPDPTGYASMAVDTRDASRALILMEQKAIALHALVAVAYKDGKDTVATGALGLPYSLPGEHGHSFNVTPEGSGILLDHDDSFSAGRTCAGDAPGHRAFAFPASALAESATPGRVVHVVALHEPEVGLLLPRPLDGSTRVLMANLYLARPGEDPAEVKAAFTPGWSAADAVPLALVGLGLAWAVRPRP